MSVSGFMRTPLATALLLLVSCASTPQGGGEGQNGDGGAGRRKIRSVETQVLDDSLDARAIEAKALKQCPLTRVGARCLTDAGQRLAPERECTGRRNGESVEEALADAGLERAEGLTMVSDPYRHEFQLGADGFTLSRDVNGQTIQSVRLGTLSDACGQQPGPLAEIARDAEGRLWRVDVRVTAIQYRSYLECGCGPQCGGAPMPTIEAIVDLPPGEQLAGHKEIGVTQLMLSIGGTEDCPPMP